MDHHQLAELIIENMGGEKNITQSWHCITRLRFNVVNNQKIKIENIKKLEGVMGAQFQGGQFQIIIGNEVANVYQEVSELVTQKEGLETAKNTQGNVLDRIFDVISGIFTPILAAITGSGLLKGIMAILVVSNILSSESSTYIVLNGIADATFHFLPFLIAFSAANKFKANASLAVALAGILMYPQFMEFAAGGEVTRLVLMGFLTIPMNSYASSVLPIILGVWLLSYVEKYATKIVPKSLSIIFVPLFSLLITAPILLAFIAPLGTMIGTYLESFFTFLFNIAGPVAGALLGGLMPLIVITGMHYAFFPGAFASLGKFGYEIMLLPLNLVANLAQAGATLGVIFKTKDLKMKQIAISSFIPALFGITEPAIYGVTMKLKKPFYASMVGGAVGGAIYGTFVVKTFSFAVPGVLAIPTYIEQGTNNLMIAIVGVLASFLTGFVMTLLLKFESGEKAVNEMKEVSSEYKSSTTEKETISIKSPLVGKVKSLSACPDKTFSSEIVGKGVGIIPSIGEVRAPFNGTVMMTTPTNHAIGILSEDGIEMLVHIGIDTVTLKGEGFKRQVNEGDHFKEGDLLVTFDIKLIEKNALSLYSPIIITNTSNYLDVVLSTKPDEKISFSKEELFIVVD